MYALDMLKRYRRNVFPGNADFRNNLSKTCKKIEFRDLGQINQEYATFDALGWKKKKKYLYILYKQLSLGMRKVHLEARLRALLAYEALHQDEFNSTC